MMSVMPLLVILCPLAWIATALANLQHITAHQNETQLTMDIILELYMALTVSHMGTLMAAFLPLVLTFHSTVQETRGFSITRLLSATINCFNS